MTMLGDQSQSLRHWYTHTLWFAAGLAMTASLLWCLITGEPFKTMALPFALSSFSHPLLDLFYVDILVYRYDPAGMPLLAPFIGHWFKTPMAFFLPFVPDWALINAAPEPSWERIGAIIRGFTTIHNFKALAREAMFLGVVIGIVSVLRRHR